MKVLVDTNVVLDIALNRKPFVENAALIWRLAEQRKIVACLSNTSITDIFYITSKHVGKEIARSFVADILDTFILADIDEEGFRAAIASDMADFEDAVQYVIFKRNGCDALVTRNNADYRDKPGVLTPTDLIEHISSAGISHWE